MVMCAHWLERSRWRLKDRIEAEVQGVWATRYGIGAFSRVNGYNGIGLDTAGSDVVHVLLP